MRQGQHSKKNRGRNRRPSNPGSRVFESNGPDVKIRGNASHVSEKYLTLARDAQAAGDPVASENYLQHAEHYLRIIAASQAQQQSQAQPCAPETDARAGGGRGNGSARPRGGPGRDNGDGHGDEERAAAAEDGNSPATVAEENSDAEVVSEDAQEATVTADALEDSSEETVPEAG